MFNIIKELYNAIYQVYIEKNIDKKFIDFIENTFIILQSMIIKVFNNSIKNYKNGFLSFSFYYYYYIKQTNKQKNEKKKL